MPSQNSLVEIPRSEWPQLRDLYQVQRTRSSAYNMLQVFINWVAKDAELNIRIFSLNGDWQSDGTFVAQKETFVYFNTLSDNHERLLAALNCLDRETSYHLRAFQDRFSPIVLEHFVANGLQPEDFQPDRTVWYHIPSEQVRQFSTEPPAGITIRFLEPRHAELVNSIWPHRFPGSLAFVETLVHYNDSVGAFDESGQLLAWCLQLPVGSLGLLRVTEPHKRRGLGSLLVRCMAKKLLEQDLEVLAPVVLTNVPSRSMFEKLGAVPVDRVNWVQKPASREV